MLADTAGLHYCNLSFGHAIVSAFACWLIKLLVELFCSFDAVQDTVKYCTLTEACRVDVFLCLVPWGPTDSFHTSRLSCKYLVHHKLAHLKNR